MRARLLLSLTILSLINLTYVDGLAPDFSDLALEAVTENGTYEVPYSMVEYGEGAWALVNASVPDENYTLNVLSDSSTGGGDGPFTLNISYQEGLTPDFSNLLIQFVGPDGSAVDIAHSVILMSEGEYAIVELERPPLENETISILSVAPSEGAEPDVQAPAENEPALPAADLNAPQNQAAQQPPSGQGKPKMKDLWPLKKGNRWTFEDGAGSASFELMLDDCGKDCFWMNQDSPAGTANVRLLIIGETIYELDQEGRRERMPLFSTNDVDWAEGNITVSIRSGPGTGELDGQEIGCTRILRHVNTSLPGGAGMASASFEACFAENYGPLWIVRPDGSSHKVVSYDIA